MNNMNCCQLVTHSESGLLGINPEASKVLSFLKEKIIIVSVTGPYRSGKSFIFNSILGINKAGFSVGNDVRACTQGI